MYRKQTVCWQDQIIIPLTISGLKGSDQEEEDDDPMLVVHPNYLIDQ